MNILKILHWMSIDIAVIGDTSHMGHSVGLGAGGRGAGRQHDDH